MKTGFVHGRLVTLARAVAAAVAVAAAAVGVAAAAAAPRPALQSKQLSKSLVSQLIRQSIVSFTVIVTPFQLGISSISQIVSLTVSELINSAAGSCGRLLLTKKLCHIKSFVCTWEPASNETVLRWPSALALP